MIEGERLTQGYSIDGRVQSILVGGHDVQAVLDRDDYWSCRFYEYVYCWWLASRLMMGN